MSIPRNQTREKRKETGVNERKDMDAYNGTEAKRRGVGGGEKIRLSSDDRVAHHNISTSCEDQPTASAALSFIFTIPTRVHKSHNSYIHQHIAKTGKARQHKQQESTQPDRQQEPQTHVIAACLLYNTTRATASSQRRRSRARSGALTPRYPRRSGPHCQRQTAPLAW